MCLNGQRIVDLLRTTVVTYEEVLERILDRGLILDGLSSLAALSNTNGDPLRATAFCSLEDKRKSTPSLVLVPPRKRDRTA